MFGVQVEHVRVCNTKGKQKSFLPAPAWPALSGGSGSGPHPRRLKEGFDIDFMGHE